MTTQEPDVLELLRDHELAIKRLYEAFAAAFPERRGFWQEIADEEQRHGDWLGTVRQGGPAVVRSVSGERLKPQAIRLSIGYVEKQIERVGRGGVSLVEALSVARDLESALLEKQFSRVDKSVPAEIRAVIESLAQDTERHRRSFVEALAAEHEKSPRRTGA